MQVPWSSQKCAEGRAKAAIVSLIWHPNGSALAVMDGFGSISFCNTQGNVMQIVLPASTAPSSLVSLLVKQVCSGVSAPENLKGPKTWLTHACVGPALATQANLVSFPLVPETCCGCAHPAKRDILPWLLMCCLMPRILVAQKIL